MIQVIHIFVYIYNILYMYTLGSSSVVVTSSSRIVDLQVFPTSVVFRFVIQLSKTYLGKLLVKHVFSEQWHVYILRLWMCSCVNKVSYAGWCAEIVRLWEIRWCKDFHTWYWLRVDFRVVWWLWSSMLGRRLLTSPMVRFIIFYQHTGVHSLLRCESLVYFGGRVGKLSWEVVGAMYWPWLRDTGCCYWELKFWERAWGIWCIQCNWMSAAVASFTFTSSLL